MGPLYQNVPPPLETLETGPIGSVQAVGRHKFPKVLQYSDFYSQFARALTFEKFSQAIDPNLSALDLTWRFSLSLPALPATG
jgi:hypothetical protein